MEPENGHKRTIEIQQFQAAIAANSKTKRA
jgi:hypothetical protein